MSDNEKSFPTVGESNWWNVTVGNKLPEIVGIKFPVSCP